MKNETMKFIKILSGRLSFVANLFTVHFAVQFATQFALFFTSSIMLSCEKPKDQIPVVKGSKNGSPNGKVAPKKEQTGPSTTKKEESSQAKKPSGSQSAEKSDQNSGQNDDQNNGDDGNENSDGVRALTESSGFKGSKKFAQKSVLMAKLVLAQKLLKSGDRIVVSLGHQIVELDKKKKNKQRALVNKTVLREILELIEKHLPKNDLGQTTLVTTAGGCVAPNNRTQTIIQSKTRGEIFDVMIFIKKCGESRATDAVHLSFKNQRMALSFKVEAFESLRSTGVDILLNPQTQCLFSYRDEKNDELLLQGLDCGKMIQNCTEVGNDISLGRPPQSSLGLVLNLTSDHLTTDIEIFDRLRIENVIKDGNSIPQNLYACSRHYLQKKRDCIDNCGLEKVSDHLSHLAPGKALRQIVDSRMADFQKAKLEREKRMASKKVQGQPPVPPQAQAQAQAQAQSPAPAEVPAEVHAEVPKKDQVKKSQSQNQELAAQEQKHGQSLSEFNPPVDQNTGDQNFENQNSENLNIANPNIANQHPQNLILEKQNPPPLQQQREELFQPEFKDIQ